METEVVEDRVPVGIAQVPPQKASAEIKSKQKEKHAIKLKTTQKADQEKAPCRPSLSEQLANIGSKAGELTDSLREKHNLRSNDSGEKAVDSV